MLSPQYLLPLNNELIIDLFAGGGGASTGIEQAIGRYVDIAINHDPEAVALHKVNHPQTTHLVSDVFEVNPLIATRGQPVGLLWASPDCKHFSKAKGGKPVNKRIRGLAWVVVKWAKAVRPKIIILENVEEFQTWGPLTDSDTPCPERKGQTFKHWKEQLNQLGYNIEHKELRACDYGAPTIRKRFVMIARCDGLPIHWPEPTHFKEPQKGQKAWKPAADIIDWTVHCPSIFERKKPLADATCRRIAKGLMRHVINTDKPFIAPINTTKGQHKELVAAFLAKHYTGVIGSDLRDPIGTVTSIDHHSLVTANLIHMGHGEGKCGTKRFSHGVRDINEPLNTVTASGSPAALVLAFLIKYYGNDKDGVSINEPIHTIPTRDRFGLVTVHGIEYQIVDIGLRMLTPRELYRAQGFPESYFIDRTLAGRTITKTAQVRMCGNSVCPPLSHALVKSNYSELNEMKEVA